MNHLFIKNKGEVSYHAKRIPRDLKLDFGRLPQWNCPIAGKKKKGGGRRRNRPTPKPAKKAARPWVIPPIQCHEPEDGVFFAQIGPTGGEQGYPSITGMIYLYRYFQFNFTFPNIFQQC